MLEQLKSLGGTGLFEAPLSTSNLYLPDQTRVAKYLAHDEKELFALLSKRLCKYHNSRYCVLFSTGFWSLVAAIKLKALPDKSQVIIPSLTYRRLADVVYWAGLTPMFVDVGVNSISICPRATEQAVNKETALILAVHPIINCCDVNAILAISKSQKIPLVFDAVESVHETLAGKRIGSFGIGEVFSLHASKLINGLEGGYICTDDKEFAQALEIFKQGLVSKYKGKICVGINGLPNAGHTSFALAGLDEIEDNVKHNREIYKSYQKNLSQTHGVRLISFDEEEQTSYKNIVAEVTDEFSVSRDKLVEILNSESILARKYYTPALHKKAYEYKTITRPMQNTEYWESRLINLPCGARVSSQDVSSVCTIINLIGNKELR